jgi:hypothetical protein
VDAAEGVVGDVPRDVRPVDDRLHQGAYLRLRGRVRAGAVLLGLDGPLHREVPVQVEALERRSDLDRDAVEVADPAFPEHAVELAFRVVGLAPDEHARFLRMGLPRAVGVAQPHHQDPAVAVEVLLVETVDLLGERPGTRAGADEPRLVGERELRPVGIEARHDVDRPRVEQARDPLVLAVAGQQAIDQVERRRRARHLDRVDVGLDQEPRLLEVGTGLGIRQRAEPDLAPFVGRSDRLHPVEVGPLVGPPLQDFR